MGAPPEPSMSTLGRFKALDSLPDLDSQLHEAKQLCDHHARAEMILRWLMGKLKASIEARSKESSWNLLESTVRLLPAQRIAVLASGIVSVLQLAWAAPYLQDDTIYAIARLFSVLIKLGKGPDGGAIRALLSVNADLAAKMCGDWYRHVNQNFCCDGKASSLEEGGLLDPALHLWDLRKRTESDDTYFNDCCMVSTLTLLAHLRNAGPSTSLKRKRGGDVPVSAPTRRYEHYLEALMARHTILPARTVFNRKHEQQPRRVLIGQQRATQPTISERLSKLGQAVEIEASRDSVVESLSLVLDIALRSVSTPTPRHRFAERPWIETLFTALCECVADQDRLAINRTLVDLLEVIRRNGLGQTALSAQTLTDLLRNHAMPSKEDVDWQLIAKIVELEPDVLTNSTITEELFSAISDDEDHKQNPLFMLWKDGIIIPAMKAFARGRSLSAFVELWHTQLLRPRPLTRVPVWESLREPFANILEEYLLADQFTALIDRFSSPIGAMLESKSQLTSEGAAGTLSAKIILLEALLRGTRSDELVSSLQNQLHALFHTLLTVANLKGFKSTISHTCHYWSLLDRAFRLWFPFWATKQDEDAIVESEGMAILTSKAFKYALAQCSASATDEPSDHQLRTAHAARGLVARLCACFQQYGDERGCAGRCTEAMQQVLKQDVNAGSVVVQQPVLLSSLDSLAREASLSSALVSARSAAFSTSPPFEALLESCQATGSRKTTADVVSLILKRVKDGQESRAEINLVSALAGIDALSIDQTLRVDILDTVSQLSEVPATQAGAVQLQNRLALLLKLSALPSQNAQLLVDPARIWALTNLLDPGAQVGSANNFDTSEVPSFDNLQLLEAVVRSVLGSWLTTQDREKSLTALMHISQIVKDTVKLGAKKNTLSANPAKLAFVKVVIEMIEQSARDDVKSRLVHRTSKTAQSYLSTLLAEYAPKIGSKKGGLATLKSILPALQALLNVPDSFMSLSGLDVPDHATQLYKIAREHMLLPRGQENELLQSRLISCCFQIICKHAPDKENFTKLAEDVLERDLKARDLSEVLRAYGEAFKHGDTQWKLVAIATLSSNTSSWTSSSVLLQQTILKALSKEDAEAMPSTKDIVFQTLQAVKPPASLASVKRTALESLTSIFKDKPFLISQHAIEQTLAALQEVLSLNASSAIGPLYLSICQVLTVILANHRSRLQGRFHLLIGLLQRLMSRLFSDGGIHAGVHEGRSLAKLLESFCNPPALRYRKGGKPSELVDEAKQAQAHAGQFAQYLLHHYCSCVLVGTLGEGVREALLPGLWAAIESMEAYNEDGIRVLSAAANHSERAVLRSVYEDWKKFGKWEGV